MRTADVMITRIELREARKRAKQLKIELPRKMTAIRSGVSRSGGEGWFLVESRGDFRKEIWAFNAYDAKAKAINELCEKREAEIEGFHDDGSDTSLYAPNYVP
jgi:hypothetical protein